MQLLFWFYGWLAKTNIIVERTRKQRRHHHQLQQQKGEKHVFTAFFLLYLSTKGEEENCKLAELNCVCTHTHTRLFVFISSGQFVKYFDTIPSKIRCVCKKMSDKNSKFQSVPFNFSSLLILIVE